LIAREVGESATGRGLLIHYPILVAGAFCGNLIWHMGYSASAPLVVAYPFYARIIGIMTDIGVAAMLSAGFASIATPETLALVGFACAMVVNLFIPSGGAQWMVQGPILVSAANDLGVELSLVVMSIAYGDQLTNLLQPLPALPLLAMAGLSLRHIMGYARVFFLAGFFLLGGWLAIVSYF
jgi:short-chain fatty acids transporter